MTIDLVPYGIAVALLFGLAGLALERIAACRGGGAARHLGGHTDLVGGLPHDETSRAPLARTASRASRLRSSGELVTASGVGPDEHLSMIRTLQQREPQGLAAVPG